MIILLPGKASSVSMLELFLWLAFHCFCYYQFGSVAQSCPTLWTPWITARQASLSITNSWSSLKLTSIESMMPSSHLILCRPLLLLPPIPPSIRVFSNESTSHEVKNNLPQRILPLCLTVKPKDLYSESCPPVDGRKEDSRVALDGVTISVTT